VLLLAGEYDAGLPPRNAGDYAGLLSRRPIRTALSGNRQRGGRWRLRSAVVWSLTVDSSDVSRWFGEYLDTFAACGRGERDTASLLAYYGVPLLLTTDGGFFALTSDDQVVAAVQQQVDGMRAAGYSHRAPRLRGRRPELHVRSLPWHLLAPQERRRRDQPAHRDLSGDRRGGWRRISSC